MGAQGESYLVDYISMLMASSLEMAFHRLSKVHCGVLVKNDEARREPLPNPQRVNPAMGQVVTGPFFIISSPRKRVPPVEKDGGFDSFEQVATIDSSCHRVGKKILFRVLELLSAIRISRKRPSS